MLVLFESPSGYAIFKVMDESKVEESKAIDEHFQLAENATNVLKLKHFKKFEDTTEALAATTAAVEGKLCKPLKKILRKVVAKDAHEKLAVADAKLGQAIKAKMDLTCIYSPAVEELMRGIRAHVNELLTGLPEKDMTAMALGLAHSLSRYKLKFSPDKVDTMIVQAISLLDDLDKELNNYVMRCREWYGWHFPELGKVVSDQLAFAKVIRKMGVRTNAATCDLSEIVPEEIEQQIKELAEVSMGTEISEEDILNITYLAEQIIEITDYRGQLYDYLKNRMAAIAPNLTILVGELVGARLIAHAGSLLNLAKHPASTVQILGAEKALFRALKTRKETPKYGLIYHASLVGQTNPKNKGKLSRMLAAKCALAIRFDALAEETDTTMGVANRVKLEQRLKVIEGGSGRISGTAKSLARDKWTNQSEVKLYDDGKDSTIPGPKKRKIEDVSETLIVADGNLQQPPSKKCKKVPEEEEKKEKKKKKVKEENLEEEEGSAETPKKKKKKKIVEETDETPTKKKKKVKTESTSETPSKKKKVKIEKSENDSAETETPSKKKKKRKSVAE